MDRIETSISDNAGEFLHAAPGLSGAESTASLVAPIGMAKTRHGQERRILMAGAAANRTHISLNNVEHSAGRAKLLTASHGFPSECGSGDNCLSSDVLQFAEADLPPCQGNGTAKSFVVVKVG